MQPFMAASGLLAAMKGWGLNAVRLLFNWEAFHKDTEGARTRYAARVRAVADRMSRHANVVGYELMNEPWGTDIELHALYEEVGAAIRERDPQRILFVPPHALVSSCMPDNNIPRVSFDNIVHAPHFYDASVVIINFRWGNSPTSSLARMRAKAGSWNAPMLLGEFGANHGVGKGLSHAGSSVTVWIAVSRASGSRAAGRWGERDLVSALSAPRPALLAALRGDPAKWQSHICW
jgi:hypothetical protein